MGGWLYLELHVHRSPTPAQCRHTTRGTFLNGPMSSEFMLGFLVITTTWIRMMANHGLEEFSFP